MQDKIQPKCFMCDGLNSISNVDLANLKSFIITSCPNCGQIGRVLKVKNAIMAQTTQEREIIEYLMRESSRMVGELKLSFVTKIPQQNLEKCIKELERIKDYYECKVDEVRNVWIGARLIHEERESPFYEEAYSHPVEEEIISELRQIQWQFEDGHTEFVAQNRISNPDEMRYWFWEIEKLHPLPEGAKWLFCNEKSEFFLQQKKENLQS